MIILIHAKTPIHIIDTVITTCIIIIIIIIKIITIITIKHIQKLIPDNLVLLERQITAKTVIDTIKVVM